MNFKTNLPKWDPLVTYIVSSATTADKNDKDFSHIKPLYRMHAVIISENYTS